MTTSFYFFEITRSIFYFEVRFFLFENHLSSLKPSMEASSKLGNSGLTLNSLGSMYSQGNPKKEVKDVWCYNLDNEMNEIMRAAIRYPYLGMVFVEWNDYSIGYCFSRNLFLHEGSAICDI